jgi:hypothetical protein
MVTHGPQPTLTLDDMRRGAHQLAQARRDARRDFERYSEQEADADREYRVTLAKVFARERSAGEPAGASEILAKAAAAEAKHKRDLAASLAKSALLRIEELERDAATLRSIADWSRAIDGAAA